VVLELAGQWIVLLRINLKIFEPSLRLGSFIQGALFCHYA